MSDHLFQLAAIWMLWIIAEKVEVPRGRLFEASAVVGIIALLHWWFA